MSSYIGAFSFLRMEGMVDIAELQMEDITRPNVAGISFWLTGFRGQAYPLVTTTLTTSSGAIETAIRAYKAATGTIYTITDDIANAYEYQMVLPKGKPLKQGQLASPTDGISIGYLIYRWNLIDVSTA